MGLRSAPTPSGGCCTQWTSRSRRIGRTLSQASSASVVIVPDATGSLWSLRPSVMSVLALFQGHPIMFFHGVPVRGSRVL